MLSQLILRQKKVKLREYAELRKTFRGRGNRELGLKAFVHKTSSTELNLIMVILHRLGSTVDTLVTLISVGVKLDIVN
jgi:hypothetical protein